LRQKSNRTLLIEQERAARKEERERKRAEKARDKMIREDRRQQKKAEAEAKRKERLRKKLTRESVERNGVPKVRPEESRFGFREAVAYSPLVICGKCGGVIRESEELGSLCEPCYFSKEVNDPEEEKLKAEENKAVPGKGDGDNETIAPVGQLTLKI